MKTLDGFLDVCILKFSRKWQVSFLEFVKNVNKIHNILLIMENATPRNSEYFLMKLGTVIRCSLKIK
jgi:hypothetical protein